MSALYVQPQPKITSGARYWSGCIAAKPETPDVTRWACPKSVIVGTRRRKALMLSGPKSPTDRYTARPVESIFLCRPHFICFSANCLIAAGFSQLTRIFSSFRSIHPHHQSTIQLFHTRQTGISPVCTTPHSECRYSSP